jgi:cob(I)alamin adenosyltransferase
MTARALGHGMRVGIVQFIKEAFHRRRSLLPPLSRSQLPRDGRGHLGNQDKARHRSATAWKKACELLQDDTVAVVLLDELILRQAQHIELNQVLESLRGRPAAHVVITGRAPKPD